MWPNVPRIASSSPAVSRKSDIQEASSSAHVAHTEEVQPANQDAVSDVSRSPIRRSSSKALVSDAQGRLVVVSNRMIDPKKPAAGGLAVALGDMMYNTDGLWMGCDANKVDEPRPKIGRTEQFGRTALVQVELPKQQYDNYYKGFSNTVLWPIFHGKVKMNEVTSAISNPAHFKAYEEVNKALASQLAPMLKNDDVLWIHDYHLIPLAQELRALGCQQRIGFFNHIPLPPPQIIKKIPQHKQLMEALFSYDLVGMQCANDVENLRQYVETEGVGQRLDDSQVEAFGKVTSMLDFPIGIDVDSFKALNPNDAPDPKSQAFLDKVRKEAGKRLLMIGVERMDYTKGIPKRLKSFHKFLDENPEMRDKVTLIQISSPTREGVPAYDKLKEKTKMLKKSINRRFGTDTWKPVMYCKHGVKRAYLPELYRLAKVGLVTPVADGMNLVAKEYIAAQNPENPGVLVLSTGAGAASQLREALLVPPKDLVALAEAYKAALNMPLEERQERYAALIKNVKTQDLPWWRNSFRGKLASLAS